MKKSRMQMTIWTRAPIQKAKTGARFLEALATSFPEGFPPRWGQSEPLSIEASPTDYSKVATLWEKLGPERGLLLGYSRALGVNVDFMLGPTMRPHEIWFFFPHKLVESLLSIQRTLKLFSSWLTLLNADFALLCLEREWVSKNVLQQYLEEDGSTDPWKVFGNDIRKGLPGVYWCSFVGSAFSQWIGRPKLADVPWPHVEQVGTGFLLRRSERPETWEKETKQDKALISHLGRERFFDIADPDRKMSVLDLPMPK
jgi:hypothetical protein